MYERQFQPDKGVWIMNQKQLIAMWCGIAAIVLAGFTVIMYYGLVCFYGFSAWVFIAALVSAGLIYTFKDQKPKDTFEEQKPKDTFEEQKPKDELQSIRDEILKKRQFKIRKDD